MQCTEQQAQRSQGLAQLELQLAISTLRAIVSPLLSSLSPSSPGSLPDAYNTSGPGHRQLWRTLELLSKALNGALLITSSGLLMARGSRSRSQPPKHC